MRVEFYDIDAGQIIYVTEKKDVDSFVRFLKSIDKINIELSTENHSHGIVRETLTDGREVELNKDNFCHGIVRKIFYDISFDEESHQSEILQVFIEESRD